MEVESLNFHQPPVDEVVIPGHGDERNDEPSNRFYGDKFSLFFDRCIRCIHFCIFPLKDILYSLSRGPLPPNGSEPVKKPQTKNNGRDVDPRSGFLFKFFKVH